MLNATKVRRGKNESFGMISVLKMKEKFENLPLHFNKIN